jgi:hypothetical protein
VAAALALAWRLLPTMSPASGAAALLLTGLLLLPLLF